VANNTFESIANSFIKTWFVAIELVDKVVVDGGLKNKGAVIDYF